MFRFGIRIGFLLLAVLCASPGIASASPASTSSAPPRVLGKTLAVGEPTLAANEHGSFYYFLPTAEAPSRTLVVVHGSLDNPEDDGRKDALRYLELFRHKAKTLNLLLIAPVFDDHNFGSNAGPGGGYRGLFGREVGADEFLNEIVDALHGYYANLDGRLYLCGHSAGAQFVNRYVVKHPSRVRAAVLSAPGTLAFPNPYAPWAYGMGRLQRAMKWGSGTPARDIDLTPDPNGWLLASQLPITVVVGSEDDDPGKDSPGQRGENHVERGRNWVDDMNAYAARNHKQGRVKFVPALGVGHTSRGLAAFCAQQLFGAEGAAK